jgi:glycosyltransferase involved in cell wall biosynthesis
MEESEIFLATPDQNEGWGATINESMNSGCAVVASHAIGAVPFMIKDGENGVVFKSKNQNDFYKKVKWLLDNPHERIKLGMNAYKTVTETWNATIACRNLMHLIDAINSGEVIPYSTGPCSHAEIIDHFSYGR